MKAAYGISHNTDSEAAAQEAANTCISKIDDQAHVFAGLVFWGADYDPDAIAKALSIKLPGVQLIGCSTDGEISSQGVSMDSVCLLLMSSTKMIAKTAVVERLSEDSAGAGEKVARELRSPDARALVLLPDGLTGNGSAIIRGAQTILGAPFVIAGGTAGDRGRFKQTWQICGERALTDSLVALMFYSPEPVELGYGVMSGWRPIGIAKTVTKAEGNVVYKIEDDTALDVYSNFLGDKAAELPAIGVEYPFALVDDTGLVDTAGIRQGEEYILLRAPMAVDRGSGAVSFAAEIPQKAKVKMTRAKSQDVIEGSREAAKRSVALLTGKPDVVMFFSCMARKVVLGRKSDQEVSAAQEVFGQDVPMAGFYTYGEIANCGERYPICRFHNETATFLAIRE